MFRILLTLALVGAVLSTDVAAQDSGTSTPATGEPGRLTAGDAVAVPTFQMGGTAPRSAPLEQEIVLCSACPTRRLGTAFLQVTMINVAYGMTNLALGKEIARVTPKTWWTNMSRGWEWDPDSFSVTPTKATTTSRPGGPTA
jgi:hypothetical protein